jgi:hypothetical protein
MIDAPAQGQGGESPALRIKELAKICAGSKFGPRSSDSA